MTAKYEAAMIFSVANGEEATLALKEKFNDLIAKNGTIENVDDWGKRRLAYLINDEAEGYYNHHQVWREFLWTKCSLICTN